MASSGLCTCSSLGPEHCPQGPHSCSHLLQIFAPTRLELNNDTAFLLLWGPQEHRLLYGMNSFWGVVSRGEEERKRQAFLRPPPPLSLCPSSRTGQPAVIRKSEARLKEAVVGVQRGAEPVCRWRNRQQGCLADANTETPGAAALSPSSCPSSPKVTTYAFPGTAE